MDWTKQANDMLKTWTGTQQKVWESWVDTMQLGATQPSQEAWQKTIETWRGTVKQALASQVGLTRMWVESVNAMPSTAGVSAPAGMAEFTNNMLEMTKVFTETQTRFSENYFEMLKKADMSALAQVWNPSQAQKIMETWQEATQKATEAQNEWAKMVNTAVHSNSVGEPNS
jgi:hypothetical protein